MITVLLLFKFEQKLRGRPFGVRSLKANDDGVLKSSCTLSITTNWGVCKEMFWRHELCWRE